MAYDLHSPCGLHNNLDSIKNVSEMLNQFYMEWDYVLTSVETLLSV